LQDYKSTVFLFGTREKLDLFLEQKLENHNKSKVKFIECKNPDDNIFKFLEKRTIDSIIRGSLSSHNFLINIKKNLNIKEINRLALLETVNGHQFFYGPVGIDECNNLEKKVKFLETAIGELYKLDIVPKVSLLSGGRKSDIGRDTKVDQTIQDAQQIVELMRKRYQDLYISHDEILIEKAVESKANLILAPNGISGTLIYRTLVHLGGGKAYGAIYMGLENPIIDTSRVGNFSEIYGALIMALALSN
jgi:putative methanogen marker protein 4